MEKKEKTNVTKTNNTEITVISEKYSFLIERAGKKKRRRLSSGRTIRLFLHVPKGPTVLLLRRNSMTSRSQNTVLQERHVSRLRHIPSLKAFTALRTRGASEKLVLKVLLLMEHTL